MNELLFTYRVEILLGIIAMFQFIGWYNNSDLINVIRKKINLKKRQIIHKLRKTVNDESY